MTASKLSALVTAAVQLDRQIEQLQAQLKALKDQIATEADTRPDEAIPTEGGGTSITFEGDNGCVARVTVTASTLKSAIKPSDKKFEKVKEAARGFFTRLFETEVVHKPVANFREQAAELLGKEAAKLVKLCENPGKTTVSFETKELAA